MKICSLPLDIAYADPEANLINAAHALSQVEADTDLVLLPELFTTAFVPDAHTVEMLAQDNNGKTVESLKRWAQFFGMALAGSFLATDGKGHYYNRGFFIEPMGDATFYDKRHLFPLSTEDKVYSPGTALSPRIRYRGWEFMMAICFDVRFPVWTRNRPGRMYDVLLVPANWPQTRAGQFKTLLAARAVENQVYVVSCNRTGQDKYGSYPPGNSPAYDNLGEPIHETRRNGCQYALLDRKALEEGRSRFPAYVATDSWDIEL